jgi:hypothetical protein
MLLHFYHYFVSANLITHLQNISAPLILHELKQMEKYMHQRESQSTASLKSATLDKEKWQRIVNMRYKQRKSKGLLRPLGCKLKYFLLCEK